MLPAKTKWQKSGLVLVCERCYKERIPDETPQIASQIGDFNLRDWLKTRLKEEGQWGHIRAISTSCMDVCAKGLVTVAIDPQEPMEPAEVFIVDPVADKETLLKKIIKKLGQ